MAIIKSSSELKPLVIKGNNSVIISVSGLSYVAGSNDDENIVWNQAQGVMHIGLVGEQVRTLKRSS